MTVNNPRSASESGAQADRVFVGREDIISNVTGALEDARPLTVFVVTGVGGVGKTSLICELRERLGTTGVNVLSTSFAEAADARVADKEELLSTYRRVLESLLGDQLSGSSADMLRKFQVEASVAGPGAVDVAHDNMRDAFVQLIAQWNKPIVILCDDVSSLDPGGVLARWLLDSLGQISRVTKVVAVFTRSGPPRIAYPGHVVTTMLGELETGDVERLLDAGGIDTRSPWREHIAQWCGGYPAGVKVGMEIARRWPDEPAKLYDKDVVSEWASHLMGPLLDSLADDLQRQVIEVGAVARYFDVELLQHALIDVDVPPDLSQWLRNLPIVDRLPDERFRLRPFLGVILPNRLCDQTPRDRDRRVGNRLEEVHLRITDYYSERILSDAEKKSYSAWLQLEDRDMQERQLEFIFHSFHTEYGLFDLVHTYFEAFWWWGSYVESYFCHRLLNNAEAILNESKQGDGGKRGESVPDSRRLLEALREFERARPAEATGEPSDWRCVIAATNEIIRLTGLADTSWVDKPGWRPRAHVLAILEVERGLAHQGLNIHSIQADTSFAKAVELFDKAGDDWCKPWVSVYQASLAKLRGENDESLKRARHGLMLATGGSDNDDRDYEVEALLHRTIAESLWDRHPLLAFQQLAKSLFYAYSFTGIPDEPDEYTRTFYRECVDCVTRRIFELTNGNPKEGRRACDAFVAFWTPHWDPPGVQPAQRSSSIDALLEKRSKDLALCLFPPEPSDRDLESGRSYAKGVRAIHEALHPDLDQRIKMLGRDGLASRMRARFTRQPDAPAAQVDLNVPNWPTEAPELFESDSDLAWPDHWRTFPPRWRELGADDATKDEIASIVHRATEDLPEMWRTVLARREFDGWSHQDVARRLGISRADQSLMLHHSRACIRRVLADYLSEEQE